MRKSKTYEEFFSSRNHLNELGISLYVDGMLLGKTDQIPEVLLNHVENCPRCKNEIIELHEICKNNPDHKMGKHPYFSTQNAFVFKIRHSVFFKAAAVLLLLISIGFVGRYIYLKNLLPHILTDHIDTDTTKEDNKNIPVPEDLIVSEEKDSISNIIDKKKDITEPKEKPEYEYIAANYEIHPDLENTVGTTYRSDIEISIISPQIEQTFEINKQIVFEWEGEIIKNPKIVVQNNKDERVVEISKLDKNKALLDSNLTPGLYYWKL